jgi:predicted kinase
MGNLLVFTGLPCSGKTTLARALCQEPSYLRVSTDELRTSLYGKTYEQLRFSERSDEREKEDYVRHLVDVIKEDGLANSYNVIVDSSAPNTGMRKRFLDSQVQGIRKYLINLIAPIDVIRQRVIERYGNTDVLDFLIERWEEPIDGFNGSRLVTVDSTRNFPVKDLMARLE